MTVTEQDQDVKIWTSSSDAHDDEYVAHIAKKSDVNEGYFGQKEIETLCGYKFVPYRNPEGLPICYKCLEVLEGKRGG